MAVDILAKSGKKKNLNRQLLECANRLAVQTDSVVHCVFVIKIPTVLKELDVIDNYAYVKKARKLVEPLAASLAHDYNILPERIHIKDGPPWGVVSSVGKKLRAQCLVVGSMGRKGISGKVVGNTAEKIIQIANTDLLVVSPEVRVVR